LMTSVILKAVRKWGMRSRAVKSKFSTSVLFFFSSRRRHTRSYGDWSSDVCSSDLAQPNENSGFDATEQLLGIKGTSRDPIDFARSEERRVGKECRSRGWRDQ